MGDDIYQKKVNEDITGGEFFRLRHGEGLGGWLNPDLSRKSFQDADQ